MRSRRRSLPSIRRFCRDRRRSAATSGTAPSARNPGLAPGALRHEHPPLEFVPPFAPLPELVAVSEVWPERPVPAELAPPLPVAAPESGARASRPHSGAARCGAAGVACGRSGPRPQAARAAAGGTGFHQSRIERVLRGELPPIEVEEIPASARELEVQIVNAGRPGDRRRYRGPCLRPVGAFHSAASDRGARQAVEVELDGSAASGRSNPRGEGHRTRTEIDALHLDVVSVLDVRDIHSASGVARGLRLNTGLPGDRLCLRLQVRIQVGNGHRSGRRRRDRRKRAVRIVGEFLEAHGAVIAVAVRRDRAAVLQCAVVIKEIRMPVEIEDAGVVREAGTERLHDRAGVGERSRGCGRLGIRDLLRDAVGRVREEVGPGVLHDPGPLFVLRREASCGRGGPERLRVVGRALDAPGIRDHVRIQLHVTRSTSLEVEVRLPVIVDEDGGIDVARAPRAAGGDERLADGVLVGADGTRRNADPNHSCARFIVYGNVDVKFAISGDSLRSPRRGARPTERGPTRDRPVVGPVHHVGGRISKPPAKGVPGDGAARLPCDVLVVRRDEVHRPVVDHGGGVGRVVGLDDGVVGTCETWRQGGSAARECRDDEFNQEVRFFRGHSGAVSRGRPVRRPASPRPRTHRGPDTSREREGRPTGHRRPTFRVSRNKNCEFRAIRLMATVSACVGGPAQRPLRASGRSTSSSSPRSPTRSATARCTTRRASRPTRKPKPPDHALVASLRS